MRTAKKVQSSLTRAHCEYDISADAIAGKPRSHRF